MKKVLYGNKVYCLDESVKKMNGSRRINEGSMYRRPSNMPTGPFNDIVGMTVRISQYDNRMFSYNKITAANRTEWGLEIQLDGNNWIDAISIDYYDESGFLNGDGKTHYPTDCRVYSREGNEYRYISKGEDTAKLLPTIYDIKLDKWEHKDQAGLTDKQWNDICVWFDKTHQKMNEGMRMYRKVNEADTYGTRDNEDARDMLMELYNDVQNTESYFQSDAYNILNNVMNYSGLSVEETIPVRKQFEKIMLDARKLRKLIGDLDILKFNS